METKSFWDRLCPKETYDISWRRNKIKHGFETTAVRRRGKCSRRRTFPGQYHHPEHLRAAGGGRLLEPCGIKSTYMDGIADALNSIRGFNMSCQVVVQSLSQWQEKYPGKEWENQLATFDQTLYMGCNDWTSADYISKKCGKVTIALTSQSKPQPPLYGFVYGNTRPYSQTRISTQRELMQPDEILRLDRRQCIALFQGRKPALLYKLSPEELPGYDTLKSCRMADYTPEWRLREEQEKGQTAKKAAPSDVSGQEPPAPPKKPTPEDEPNPSQDVEYQLTDKNQGLGMVELGPDGVVGGDVEDEESPPGR